MDKIIRNSLIADCKVCNGRTNQYILIYTKHLPICWKCEKEIVSKNEEFKNFKHIVVYYVANLTRYFQSNPLIRNKKWKNSVEFALEYIRELESKLKEK